MTQSSIFHKIRLFVKQVPYGKVATYGQIAKVVGVKSARVVGWAMRDTKDQSIPCHRIIKSDGSLSEKFGQGGKFEQKALLLSEGIFFDGFNVNLEKYQWILDTPKN